MSGKRAQRIGKDRGERWTETMKKQTNKEKTIIQTDGVSQKNIHEEINKNAQTDRRE